METGFNDQDLELMKSLKYDPSLKPNYESLKGCLIWKDERSDDLSPDAYHIVSSLFVARSLLHQGLTFDDHPVDPEYCKNLWVIAQKQIADWPGFKRLTLNDEDRKYLEERVAQAEGGEL